MTSNLTGYFRVGCQACGKENFELRLVGLDTPSVELWARCWACEALMLLHNRIEISGEEQLIAEVRNND